MAEWLVDASGNRHNQTYVKGFVDISGSDLSGNALTVRNGNINLPNSSISSSAIAPAFLVLDAYTDSVVSTDKLEDLNWVVNGTTDILNDTRAMHSKWIRSGGTYYYNCFTLNLKPGVYIVTFLWDSTGNNEVWMGCDIDNSGDFNDSEISFMRRTIGEMTTNSRTLVLPNNRNFHIISYDITAFNTTSGYYPQITIHRIGEATITSNVDQALTPPVNFDGYQTRLAQNAVTTVTTDISGTIVF